MVVCHCHVVSDRELRTEIASGALDAADLKAGRRIEMPMLALWGADRKHGFVNKPLENWRPWCPHVEGAPIASGHFLAEEAPEETLAALLPFLEPWRRGE